MINFSSGRKCSEILNKKMKLKKLDIRKYDLNDGSMSYINKSICPCCHGLWRKCNRLWQDKVIASFYTIKDILRVKQCENDKPIIVTHDSEQEQLLKIVRKYLWSACK